MSNYKTVFFILGILQIILGVSMVFPIITQFIFEELDSSFISASIITIIFGTLFLLSNLENDRKLNLQNAFLLTSLACLQKMKSRKDHSVWSLMLAKALLLPAKAR